MGFELAASGYKDLYWPWSGRVGLIQLHIIRNTCSTLTRVVSSFAWFLYAAWGDSHVGSISHGSPTLEDFVTVNPQ